MGYIDNTEGARWHRVQRTTLLNLAMLAKQVWTLLQNTNSLSYRILKAKYFPRCDLLCANIGHKPSYLWRSLLSSKEIIQEGSAWRVGDGRSIKIRTERWIGVRKPDKPGPAMQEEDEGVTVDTLIDEQRRQWIEAKITENFNQEDRTAIMTIPLSRNRREDKRTWRLTDNGLFTVKSAYHMAVAKFSRIHDNRPSSSMVPREWKKIWSLKVAPRVKMFVWRACTGSLPSKVNLCRRGCHIDPICALCGETKESIDHLLIKCKQVCLIWYGSVLRLNMNEEGVNTFRELIWKKISIAPDHYMEILCYIAWEIWRCRNKVCFGIK